MRQAQLRTLCRPDARGLVLCGVATMWIGACTQGEVPAPRPVELVPSTAGQGISVTVRILGQGFAPRVRLSYNSASRSSVDPIFRALLDDVELAEVRYVSASELVAVVPGSLPPGSHPLLVIAPDQQRGELARAFTVLPDPLLDAGGEIPDGSSDRGIRPDAALPDSARLDVVALDAGLPDATSSDSASTDTALPDAAAPDAAAPDTAQRDVVMLDTAAPEAAVDGGNQDAGIWIPFPGGLPAAGWSGGGAELHIGCGSNGIVRGFEILTGTTWIYAVGQEHVYKLRAECVRVRVQGSTVDFYAPNYTTAVGGSDPSSDGPYNHLLTCPAGHAVVGFTGWNGGWVLSGLEILCAPLDPVTLAPDLGAVISLPRAGRIDALQAGPHFCPVPQVATGFEGYAGEVIDAFTLRCGPVP